MSIARFVEISMYVSGFVLMAAIVYVKPLGNVFDYILGFSVFVGEIAVGRYVGNLLRKGQDAQNGNNRS